MHQGGGRGSSESGEVGEGGRQNHSWGYGENWDIYGMEKRSEGEE